MKTTSEALSTDEADSRWAEVGPNVAAASKHRGWSWRLLSAARNPLVPLVFLIDGFTKHNWQEAFLFSIAVAVGLTPEMLPMIVSVCLSKGALAMSKKKVIVKQLNAIQNFGAMDVLCTNMMPFIHGRASWQLTLTTGAIMAVAAWLPYSPSGPALGFTALPPLYWPILLATPLCYVALTQT